MHEGAIGALRAPGADVPAAVPALEVLKRPVAGNPVVGIDIVPVDILLLGVDALLLPLVRFSVVVVLRLRSDGPNGVGPDVLLLLAVRFGGRDA